MVDVNQDQITQGRQLEKLDYVVKTVDRIEKKQDDLNQKVENHYVPRKEFDLQVENQTKELDNIRKSLSSVVMTVIGTIITAAIGLLFSLARGK